MAAVPRYISLALLCCTLTLPAACIIGTAPAAAKQRASAAQKIVSIARAELKRGVRERPDGSNRGTRIKMYGQSTTPRFYPAPWCAYFTSWVAKKAGRPIGPGGRGLGYVPYIRSWAKSTKKWRRTPRPGDLITFPQHVGIVEKVYANRTLTTIEGNASNRVLRRWRKWSEASGYVRLAAGGKISKPDAGAEPRKPGKPRSRPKARIKAYPGLKIAVGQTIDFTSNESSGDIRKAHWDLNGNGSYEARGDSVSRTYTQPGNVTVRLKVTDAHGRVSRAAATVTVRDNKPPVAQLTVSSTQLKVGGKLYGDASASYDPDGKIVRYEWDLNGDGNFGKGGAKSSTRIHDPGVYHVGVRVTDDDGNQSTAYADVTVTAYRPPVAQVRCDADTLPHGQTLTCWSASDAEAGIDRYDWDMNGDGDFSKGGPKSTYRYTVPGTYRVGLRVTDERGQRSDAAHVLQVTNQPPDTKLKLNVTELTLGERLYGDASASRDPDGKISYYEWDLDGDGSYTKDDAWHSARMERAGTFTARVRAVDSSGERSEASVQVTVLPRPADADIAVHGQPLVDRDLTLDASGSTSPDSRIISYQWDLYGDGSFEAEGPTQTVRYSSHGERTVRLRVTDAFGQTDVSTSTFLVLAPPSAAVRHADGILRVGQSVSFSADQASDRDGHIVRYQWDFDGDGRNDKTTYDHRSGSRRYWSAGFYTVRVTVTDDDGLKDTAELQIAIAP